MCIRDRYQRRVHGNPKTPKPQNPYCVSAILAHFMLIIIFIMETGKDTSAGSLIIAPEYSKEEYEIFALPEAKLTELLNTPQSFIKDSSFANGGESRSATLSTSASTFDLVKLDSSNLLLLVKKSNEEYLIHKQDRYVIEMEQSQPSKSQVWQLMKLNAVYYDSLSEIAGLQPKSDQGLKFEYILEKCQVSEKELVNILKELNAFEINNKFFIFHPMDCIDRGKSLLLELHKAKPTWNAIEDEMLRPLVSNLPEGAAKALLNSILDFDGQKWALSGVKAKALCATLLFNEKHSYILKEFALAFDKIAHTLLPSELVKVPDEDWRGKNLFPGYGEVDLRFLNGVAVIAFDNKVPVIEHIDRLNLSGNSKKRFVQLGSVKKEWTKQELQYWLSECLPPSQSIDNFLAKNARAQNIPHPFVSKSKIQTYAPK
eukprot:TRINITY_DN9367_c0_g4_i2.p1 TRINITY_DN9367_c0_g4~~TRINITY_DN9367_c0_g4_i2.p1  ORF type:complete len:444 (-),score=91.54 TRINITY_DN9367_c0_g4_i2:69-1355(-)